MQHSATAIAAALQTWKVPGSDRTVVEDRFPFDSGSRATLDKKVLSVQAYRQSRIPSLERWLLRLIPCPRLLVLSHLTEEIRNTSEHH